LRDPAAITDRLAELRRIVLAWLTRDRMTVCLVGLFYFLIFCWPRVHMFEVAAWAGAALGAAATGLFGLTFRHPVRVRIGRLGMRYRNVRRIAGTVAAIGISLFMVYHAGLHFRSPPPPIWPMTDEHKFGVGLVHLTNDPDHRYEQQLANALGELDPGLRVQVLRFDTTIAAGGLFDEIDTDRLLTALSILIESKAQVLIRGGVHRVGGEDVVVLYETPTFVGYGLGGTADPRDFRFPQLPPAQLAGVVCLVIASGSLSRFNGADRPNLTSIDPLIERVRALADDPAPVRLERGHPGAR
jgi:hypothetical protein